MSFRVFWTKRSVFLPDAPCTLPTRLPDLKVASVVFATFKLEFDQFEKALRQKRAVTAQQNRKNNPVKVFNDVAVPRALSVQTVARNNIFTVTEVSEDGLQFTVTPQGLLADRPVLDHKEHLQTVSIHASGFTLSKGHDLEVGSVVTQKVHLGNRSEVLNEFEKMWLTYWGKHADTEPSRWHDFIEVCKRVLPEPDEPMKFTPITPTIWLDAVRRRKQRSATGPDGISRVDLLKMGSAHVDTLMHILQLVEQGARWPESCLNGLISSLAKKETSEFVHEFRPICVFSLVYRCWSSIRAREILRYLSARAPAELIGNRPRHETAEVWWSIACQVEASYHGGPALAGTIADITKCFNALPRIPIVTLARLLHLPKAFCDAWCGALTCMQRRFVVEGGVGQPLFTSNGFPEGDPLSVCAMFMVNLALHAFASSRNPEACVWTFVASSRNPEACVWTFVDDWQIPGTSPEEVLEGMDSIRLFCDMLGLTLDEIKTFFWGSNASFRQTFRDLGKVVKLHLRNLGGHVSYSRLATNHTVTSRITQSPQFWHWMKRSPAPLDHKIRLLPVVAWPRFLHGSAGVPIGEEHFRKLRSKAMQSLSFDKKGANPLLQLGGILHPKHDPAFYVLAATFRAFRRFCLPDVAFPILNALAAQSVPLRGPGPCEVFLSRLHEIGWSWQADGLLLDHDGLPVHILHCPIQLLQQRIVHAWQARIGETVSHREGFQGLENFSPQLTVGYDQWDSESIGLLRVVLNGSFFTRDKQYSTGKVPSVVCPFCFGCEDSIVHRHFGCPHFQHLRNQIPGEFFTKLDELPECSLQHGWMCHPASLHPFRQALVNLPDLTYSFCGGADIPTQGPLHLFTDGSCIHPAEPMKRLASWGFCAADLRSDGFVPIAQGPVWGLFQSVLRGEYIACISAYQFALSRHQCFWVWTDSQLVFDFLEAVKHGSNFNDPMIPDHDLKRRLGFLHKEAIRKGLLVRIIKVRSHMNISLFSNKVEQWAFRGNDTADLCASRGLDILPSEFWDVWQQLGREIDDISTVRKHLHSLIVQIGQVAVQSKGHIREVDAQQWEDENRRENPVDDTSELSCRDLPPTFDFGRLVKVGYRTLGPMAPIVYQWLVELVSSPEGVSQWVNTYQLLIIFQQQTGHVGLRRDSKGRLYHQISKWDAGQEYDFLTVAGDFGIFLRALLKRVGTIFEFKKRRPSGTSFRGWTNCVRLNIQTATVFDVDRFLVHHHIAPVQDVRRSLKVVPLALQDVS